MERGKGGEGQGCIRREGASEEAPEAVGGGCQSGWGQLLSVTNATEAGTWREGQWLGAPGGGGLPPLPMHAWEGALQGGQGGA